MAEGSGPNGHDISCLDIKQPHPDSSSKKRNPGDRTTSRSVTGLQASWRLRDKLVLDVRRFRRRCEIKLRQLTYLCEVQKQGYNVSAAAKALYTSQPGVSKQLIALAEELGIEIFVHRGKRLEGLTEPGEKVVRIAKRILDDVRRIADIGAEYKRAGTSELVIVANRHMANTRLRDAVIAYYGHRKEARVRVLEEEPGIATRLLTTGAADIAITSELRGADLGVVRFPLETWRLNIVVPTGHPLLKEPTVSFELLADYQLCSYERSAVSRQLIDASFEANGYASPITFAFGRDIDILSFIENGIGIGIVAEAALDHSDHPKLRALDASHLFRPLTTYVALRSEQNVPDRIVDFLRFLVPGLDRSMIESAPNAATRRSKADQELRITSLDHMEERRVASKSLGGRAHTAPKCARHSDTKSVPACAAQIADRSASA